MSGIDEIPQIKEKKSKQKPDWKDLKVSFCANIYSFIQQTQYECKMRAQLQTQKVEKGKVCINTYKMQVFSSIDLLFNKKGKDLKFLVQPLKDHFSLEPIFNLTYYLIVV